MSCATISPDEEKAPEVDPLSLLTLPELVELLKLTEQQAAAESQNGLAYYRPHAKQSKFHSLADFTFRYLRTGNRFGKSDCGAAEDCAFALGERPWLPKDHPDRYRGIPHHSVKLLIICTDWKKADEIFTSSVEGTSQGKLFKFLPKNAIVNVEKDHGGHIHRITVKSVWGGFSTINLDTVAAFQQNEQKSESSSWDAIHVDEPIPRDMWVGVSRGLMDREGKAWFTCTPLTEPWINDFFHAGKRANLHPDLPNISGECVTLLGSTKDNPYISKKGQASFEAGLTEKEKASRLHGLPLEQTGLIYTEFSDAHVYTEIPRGWESLNRPPSNYTVRYALDPHPSTPHAVLFCATAPDDSVWFFQEIFDPCTSTELAEQVIQTTAGLFLAHAICDPSAYILSPTDKRSMADDFMEAGLILDKGPKDPCRGILAVQKALSIPGRLNFAHNLSELLYEFDRYVWDPKRPNKPRDKDDHMLENLYRLVLTGLHYITVDDEDYSRIIPFNTPTV